MPETKNKLLKILDKQWFRFTAVFLILIIVFIGVFYGWQKAYANKFLPGTHIGYLNVSGMTKDQAGELLGEVEKNIRNKGLIFKNAEKEISVSPIILSESPDLALDILNFDVSQTLDKAYQAGRSNFYFLNPFVFLKSAIFGYQAQVVYELNEDKLLEQLMVSFSDQEKPAINATLKIDGNNFEVIGGSSGYIYDYNQAVTNLKNNLDQLNFDPVELALVFKEPTINKADTGSAVNSLEKILEIDSIKLIDGESLKNWDITKTELIDWLEFQKIDNDVIIGVNKEKVEEFLKPIVEAVNVDTVDAKFKLSGNRVSEFQSSRDGVTLNMEETYTKINQQIMLGVSDDITLVVKVVPAKVATKDLNDLGIEELIGRGVSNFAGSPVNRRHNIKTGTNSLNGVLIAPNEDFSLLDALGEIDGANGYLQELVIKGDRTIPEYGGGLCQIGSTTFRAALWSGLPITARRNHSYRVVYYEPAGMDATIYDPAPDMRFLNDTGHHILFTAKMDGDDLIFEFYGTPDGRQVSIEPNPPTIYNITSPGAPRYVETDELAPGEKKKIESAHNGADTYFKYTVTYPDGEIKEEEFYSHYVSWPEVWLIGRESTTTDEVLSEIPAE